MTQSQDGNNRKLNISQAKFTADGSTPKKEFKWMVPISVCTQSDPQKIVNLGLLDKECQEFTVSDSSPDSWIKVNRLPVVC